MLTSLYAGLSGLDATGQWLQVISNNVANSGTVGFKSSRALFAEMVGATYQRGGARGVPGIGTRPVQIEGVFVQGTVSATGQPLDLAIEGNGFFHVKDGAGRSLYTRAGGFALDAQGRVVTAGGKFLQGYLADESGTVGATLGTLTTAASSGSGRVAFAPKATEKATIAGNLDATAAAIPGGFDLGDPSGTSNFATSMTMYDDEGAGSPVTVYFTKTGTDAWTYSVVAGGAVAGSGSLSFRSDGTPSGAATGSVSLTLGGKTATVEFDLSGMTQYGSASAITAQSQDGEAAGTFERVAVDGEGTLIAEFSNGRSRALGRVALVGFVNPQGLARLNDNLFEVTEAAGTATTAAPGSGGLGRIVPASLEQSNVDLSDQFVDMIAAQREYQANSRVITTSDELLVEIMGLKR
jgi:flagellar hook protein FlgE